MPQFFLSGWLEATPGEGTLRFRLPADTENAMFDFHFRDDAGAAAVEIHGEVAKNPHPTQSGEEIEHTYSAIVEWSNPTYRTFIVDYDIAPFMAVPTE